MAKEQNEERWERGTSALFQRRKERREADRRRRQAGRKFIKSEDVKLQWEEENGIWIGGLVSQELGFDNRVIEVDCHIYPPHSHSCTHKHNEAIIFVLRGKGYSILDDERIDWEPGDTLYVGQGVWHQHHVTSEEPAMVIAIKPLPLQEYLGELNIVYKGDKPSPVRKFSVNSFKEEFAKLGRGPR
jgi:quercetin dioxygenase-like cupin family protein